MIEHAQRFTENIRDKFNSAQMLQRFTGVEDITCIIDPALEASHPNRIFCVDKRNGARYGQGPIVQKAFDDPYIATSGDVMFEFFEYKIVDGSNIVQASDESVYDRKFSFYITVATA